MFKNSTFLYPQVVEVLERQIMINWIKNLFRKQPECRAVMWETKDVHKMKTNWVIGGTEDNPMRMSDIIKD